MDPREPLRRMLTDDALARLGFRPDDAAAAREAGERVLADDADRARVGQLADRLRARIGDLAPQDPPRTFDEADDQHPHGRGVLPMLALLATAEDVVAYHRGRGVDEATSWGTLADLGQQVWVNRLTYAEFGLHTHRWLTTAWSGALLWLGRLQFNLHRVQAGPHRGTLALSTHIPQSGPLDPDAVADAFDRAERAFADWYADQRPAWFHCASWLLDPQLGAGLPGSNIALFGALWELFGEPEPGDADAVFFTFRRRGAVDPDDLATNSRLEALVVSHLRSGEPMHVRHGRRPFAGALAS